MIASSNQQTPTIPRPVNTCTLVHTCTQCSHCEHLRTCMLGRIVSMYTRVTICVHMLTIMRMQPYGSSNKIINKIIYYHNREHSTHHSRNSMIHRNYCLIIIIITYRITTMSMMPALQTIANTCPHVHGAYKCTQCQMRTPVHRAHHAGTCTYRRRVWVVPWGTCGSTGGTGAFVVCAHRVRVLLGNVMMTTVMFWNKRASCSHGAFASGSQ